MWYKNIFYCMYRHVAQLYLLSNSSISVSYLPSNTSCSMRSIFWPETKYQKDAKSVQKCIHVAMKNNAELYFQAGSRKYPYPHHGGNWTFRRGGGGVKDPGNSVGEGGWTIDLVSRCPSIQYGFRYRSRCSKILSYLLSRSFT